MYHIIGIKGKQRDVLDKAKNKAQLIWKLGNHVAPKYQGQYDAFTVENPAKDRAKLKKKK